MLDVDWLMMVFSIVLLILSLMMIDLGIILFKVRNKVSEILGKPFQFQEYEKIFSSAILTKPLWRWFYKAYVKIFGYIYRESYQTIGKVQLQQAQAKLFTSKTGPTFVNIWAFLTILFGFILMIASGISIIVNLFFRLCGNC